MLSICMFLIILSLYITILYQYLICLKQRGFLNVLTMSLVNRPGVAGAVLQTPLFNKPGGAGAVLQTYLLLIKLLIKLLIN